MPIGVCAGLRADPLQLVDRPADAAGDRDSADAGDEHDGVDLEELVRGGNPKMAYANRQVHLKREFLNRPMTKNEVKAGHLRNGEEYDGDPSIRARWTALFAARQRQRTRLSQVPSGPPSSATPEEMPRQPVWPEGLQDGDTVEDAPIASTVLANYHSSLSVEGIEKLASDAKPFTVQEDCLQEHVASQGSLWGCGGEWHNVCTKQMAQRRTLRKFDVAKASVEALVDSIDKTAIKTKDCLFHFSSKRAVGEGRPSCPRGSAPPSKRRVVSGRSRPRCGWLLRGHDG